MCMWACAKCVSESGKYCMWDWAAVDLDRKTSFPLTLPPPRLSTIASHFFLFPPLSLFLVPPLSLSSSTSTGLSKWSQRNALWSNNPGGWHHIDESERRGERTREVREVEKLGKGDSCKKGRRSEEIKMHEHKLESNRAQSVVSKVRLSLTIRGEMDVWRHKFCKYTQRNIFFRHAIALPLRNYKAKTGARVTMQKMNSSTAVILLCIGMCGTKGSALTAFSPGISMAACPLQTSLPMKILAKLHLNFGWQDGVLLSFSQGRAATSLGDSHSRSPQGQNIHQHRT